MRRHPTQRLAALAAAFVGLLALTASTANAAGVSPAFYPAGAAHAQITGSGSSWSANAVNQWIADVTSSGLQVVFTSTGSATGRKDFTNRTTDFAVTDIGYQGVDKVTGEGDSNCTDPNTPATCRAFAYLPVVAGGTGLGFRDPLLKAHANGVAVTETVGDGKTEITPGTVRRQPLSAYNDFALVAQSPADYYELYLYNAISKTDSAEISFGDESMAAVKVTLGSRRDGANPGLPSWRLRIPA